jgi:5'-deoxynucleotidase YfbR-like HD superfamily hydrolase
MDLSHSSKYSRKEDVLRDLIAVVSDTRKVIHEYFQKFEEKAIAEKIDELVKELTSKELKK